MNKTITKQNLIKEALEPSNNGWEFVSNFSQMYIGGLEKQIKQTDVEVLNRSGSVKYKLVPSFLTDGIENINITIEAITLNLEYFYYDANDNESPKQNLTINTTDGNIKSTFLTKGLKFNPDGSFNIEGVSVSFMGNNNIEFELY